MPRLLIVSAHFPPVNAPDMQRVRMSLPHFVEAGWEVVVLTVDDHEPMAPLEPELLATLPKPVHIVRAPIFSRRWTRFVGINNLGLRSLPFIYEAGSRLLTEQKFDLVYFSTTQFVLCPLGRLWQREFGVPYVIDLQDPWLNEYYSQPGAPKPPGGWKYIFTYASAKLLEGWTLRNCAHVISVSSAYIEVLGRRYSWFDASRASVVTFGAPDADFALVRERLPRARRILPASPELKIAYAGRLGPDMLPALDALFAGLARTDLGGRKIGLYFYGTSYARAGTGVATTTALARKHGVTAQVHEEPARIGYLDAPQILLEADIALLLGSEDRAYSPSKVYPTLLSGTPAFAVAPRDSVLQAKVNELGGSALVAFDPANPASAADEVATVIAQLAVHGSGAAAPALDRARLEAEYTAAAVSMRQLQIFNRVLRDYLPPEDDFDVDDYLSQPIGGTR